MWDLIVFQIFAFLFTYDNSDLSFREVKVVFYGCVYYMVTNSVLRLCNFNTLEMIVIW